MAALSTSPALYGLVAEFDTQEALLEAARRVHAAGYRRTDAFSPYPIFGLADALGFHDRRLSLFTLIGGIAGLAGGYGIEYWTQVVNFPINIGGRPFHSWVAFIPPAFEATILVGAFTAGISMLLLNGLPRPYHPLFNAPRFSHATQDGFFLAIEASDPKFQADDTRAFLASLQARDVVAVDE
jgi:Alternative complex III, ActD subunit